MKKSDINQPPCYFDKYLDFVEDVELSEAFVQSKAELETLNFNELEQIGDTVYAPGKWTIKDIFQHLIDGERVLAYRVLRIGRNDQTELPSFDQDLFAANVNTKNRTLRQLVSELGLVREATRLLFESFDDEASLRALTINGNHMSALAYGFAIVGHQRYHLQVIHERYLPLKAALTT
ncbi:MAG TPA: DinB family protein [Pyrinomonadaceae bacterium]